MDSAFTRVTRAATVLAVAAVLGATWTGPAVAAAPVRVPPAQHAAVPATGTITVMLDPGTLTATPSHGGTRCLFQVESVLDLDGTVEGTATGTTRALIHAPCAEATSNPPGTFADTFAFTGDFTGTVAGTEAAAEVRYAGRTRAGGEVTARLFLNGDATVVAAVQARAAEGGTYRGIAAAR